VTEQQPPVFEISHYDFTIDENASNGQNGVNLGQVTATDPAGNTIRYVFTDDQENRVVSIGDFTINPSDGTITYTGTGLDAEEVGASSVATLQVLAVTTGSDGSEYTDQVTVSITVQDLNDEAPVITSMATATALPENTEVATTAAVYTATGTHDLTAITWSLESAGDGGLFDIDPATGVVTFKAATIPDYETKASYSFTVTATSGTEQVSLPVTLAVTNVDEMPVFSVQSSMQSATENSNLAVANLSIFDDDDQGAPSGVSLELKGDDADLFNIDWDGSSSTFDVVWKSGQAPDYDDPGDKNGDNTYEFTVCATIGATTLEQNLTITVSDINEAPEIDTTTTDYIFTIGDADNTIVTLSAIDEDGDTLSWKIEGADKDFFNISSAGIISWKTSPDVTTQSTNTDNPATFMITAIVSDDGQPSLEDEIALNISLFAQGGG